MPAVAMNHREAFPRNNRLDSLGDVVVRVASLGYRNPSFEGLLGALHQPAGDRRAVTNQHCHRTVDILTIGQLDTTI